MPVITRVEERGRDLIINRTISVPKDKVALIKHSDFVEIRMDQRYFSEEEDRMLDYLEVYHETCEEPDTNNNNQLFAQLQLLKD